MFKKAIFLLALLFSSLFIQAQNWQTDLQTAEKIAAEKNEPIVLVFQGSDWCAPCIKLDRSVWSTETFKSYSKEHFVMLQADFPRRKENALSEEQQEKNNQLAEKYNKNGIFPLVVVLDKNGTVLGETGYMKTTPEEYIKYLESFKG